MSEHLKQIAKQWLTEYTFMHEWVFKGGSDKQERMMEALKYSPLGVSVVGWRQKDGLYVKYPGERDQHWTDVVGYEKDKHWIIYDSYPPFIKHLAWDYDFGFAKRYHVERITPLIYTPVKKNDFYGLIMWLIKNIFNRV